MEVFWEYARAFLCGGALCLIGQLLIDKTKLTPARILVLMWCPACCRAGWGSTSMCGSSAERGPPSP